MKRISIIASLAILSGFAAKPPAAPTMASTRGPASSGESRPVFQDSLPPLHTIKSEDIDGVSSSFETQMLTVKLKNGRVYTYTHIDWDFEDSYPGVDHRIVEGIKNMDKTFTRVENPPRYPGGQEAWDKYMHEFCARHQKEIKRRVPAEIMVQCIVHMKGQLAYIQVIGEGRDNKLAPLAVQAIRESQPWLPAMQNGHKVVSYMRQPVKFSL